MRPLPQWWWWCMRVWCLWWRISWLFDSPLKFDFKGLQIQLWSDRLHTIGLFFLVVVVTGAVAMALLSGMYVTYLVAWLAVMVTWLAGMVAWLACMVAWLSGMVAWEDGRQPYVNNVLPNIFSSVTILGLSQTATPGYIVSPAQSIGTQHSQ